MKSSTTLIIMGAAALLGVGGSLLFIHLADRARSEAVTARSRLAALENDVAASDSLARLDSVNANFMTYDLSFHELRGRVRHVTYGEESVDFDRDGNWTNPQAYISRAGNSLNFGRDKFGCIINGISTESADGQPLEQVEYTWGDNRVKRISSSGIAGQYRMDFVYDGKLRLTQLSVVSSDEESKSEIVTSYTYQDFDHAGNWTRRTARSSIKTTVAGGYYDEDSGTFINSSEPVYDSNEEVETRSITYYPS